MRNRRLLDDRAGLYTIPGDIMTNAVSMLLPFPIRHHGHVLRSDGVKVGKPSHNSLYHRDIGDTTLPAHRTSLEAVLASWGSMVANDDWVVDENGVMGGEEKWRMADTEEHAEYFQTEVLCYPPERDGEGEEEGNNDEKGNDRGDAGDDHDKAGDIDGEERDNTENEDEQTVSGDRERKRTSST